MTKAEAERKRLEQEIRMWNKAKAEGLDQAATVLMQKACDWFCKASDVGDCTARVLRDQAMKFRREAEGIRKANVEPSEGRK